MSSLDKMLAILDLFDQARTGVQLDDVMRVTQGSRATAYRYLQALAKAGLVAPATGGSHVLGPRIVELDRLVQMTDPLLTSAARPMRDLAEALHANVLLCSYYGNKVLCVDLLWPDRSVDQAYERGRPMPMFRGAMAKTILAHLTPYHLRNIMAWHGPEIRSAGLGEDWEAFRSNMARLRRAGVVVTRGEVVPNLVGIGAPLFDPEGRVLGSLVLAIAEARYDAADTDALASQLAGAARRIGEAIAAFAVSAPKTAPRSARPRRARPALDSYHTW